MTTIKDIAKAAGVAQGTVSNVLNGKGNVSSEKIRQVMDAASALGYVPNERAKLLRKGRSNTLGVILPNIRSKQYIDFYLSFKAYAENHGYSVSQYLTSDDNREAEYAAIQDLSNAVTSMLFPALTRETVKASLLLKPPACWAYPPERSIMASLRERSPPKSSIPGGLGRY